jgi:hypothetical protein
MPNEILTERLQYFTPEYYDFLMSDFVEIAGAEAQSRYGLDEDTRTAFENMLCLNITLFIHRIEFIESVIVDCGLNISDAINLVSSTLEKLPKEMVLTQQEVALSLAENYEGLVLEKDRFNFVTTLPLQKLTTYLYVKTASRLTDICQSHNITDDATIELFYVLLGDIVLGIYKIEDVVPLLQQELNIDVNEADLLGAEVIEFFKSLPETNWQPRDLKNTSNITEKETLVPQIRTMAADMLEERSPVRSTFNAAATIDEPVYVSTQPTIEKQILEAPSYTTPLYQAPKPNVDAPLERPRWS